MNALKYLTKDQNQCGMEHCVTDQNKQNINLTPRDFKNAFWLQLNSDFIKQ